MPDQSSAADEHALISEITEPLGRLPDDPVREMAETEFPTVLRGYDKFAVDAYVRKTNQLVAELQARSSPQAAVRRALERVGEDVSGILKRAHETAQGITAQSRREAEDRLELARQEAGEVTAKARARVKELDADTDRIWAERDRIVADARDLARQLLQLADEAAARFPADEDTGEAAEAPADGAGRREPVPGEPAAALGESVEEAPATGGAEPLDAEPDDLEPPEANAAPADSQATQAFPVPPPAPAPPDEDQATQAFEPFDAENAEGQALPGELRFSRGPDDADDADEPTGDFWDHDER